MQNENPNRQPAVDQPIVAPRTIRVQVSESGPTNIKILMTLAALGSILLSATLGLFGLVILAFNDTGSQYNQLVGILVLSHSVNLMALAVYIFEQMGDIGSYAPRAKAAMAILMIVATVLMVYGIQNGIIVLLAALMASVVASVMLWVLLVRGASRRVVVIVGDDVSLGK